MKISNFPSKLLLTNRQAPNLREPVANNLSTIMKLLKTQLSKITYQVDILVVFLVHY